MRKHELRVIEENLIKKTDEFEGGDGWQPWQLSSWRNLRQRTVEIIYQGPNVKITENKIPKPFFELSEKYIGLYVDPKMEADVGLDLLIMPHYKDDSAPVVCLTYSVDVWPSEMLMIFRKNKFNVKKGDAIAEAMLVYRCETVPRTVFGEEEKIILEKRDQIEKGKKEATRKNNFSGTEMNNYYEIFRRKAKVPTRLTPIIFKRGYVQ